MAPLFYQRSSRWYNIPRQVAFADELGFQAKHKRPGLGELSRRGLDAFSRRSHLLLRIGRGQTSALVFVPQLVSKN
jgi:hypothetical protein